MGNDVKVFEHGIFGKIRVISLSGEPGFNLYDTAFALGYTRENAKGVLYLRKDKLVSICETLDIKGVTLGVTGIIIDKDTDFQNTYLEEESLYDLMLESKAKNARSFRKWITSDVIPSIRKTGGYVDNEDLFINTYLPYADENTKILFKGTLETVRSLNSEIKRMKPKEEYFDLIVERNLLTNFRDTAKELKVKQNEFISFLIDSGYIYRDTNEKIKPYAQHSPGLFEMKDFVNKKTKAKGVQTLITPKGRETFRLLLQNNKLTR